MSDGSYSVSDVPNHFEYILKKYGENIDYQQNSRVLYTFVPNKPFDSLLEISQKNHIFLKIFNSELQDIRVCLQTKIVSN